jgi:hypothetical protein
MSFDLDFTDTSAPKDEPVPTQYEYACQVCGKELFYGGRGRKPVKCDEHKTTQSKKGSGSNANMARQASNILSEWNTMVRAGLMIPYIPFAGVNPVYLPDTAEAIKEADEVFTDQAYRALLADPKLCKLIIRIGASSGKMSLIVAYGMLGVKVFPVAVNEMKDHKENSDNRSQVA